MMRRDDISIDNDQFDFVKIVYEDNKESKVIRGWLINENEFLYIVKGQIDNKIVDIGKRALIKKTIITEGKNDR